MPSVTDVGVNCVIDLRPAASAMKASVPMVICAWVAASPSTLLEMAEPALKVVAPACVAWNETVGVGPEELNTAVAAVIDAVPSVTLVSEVAGVASEVARVVVAVVSAVNAMLSMVIFAAVCVPELPSRTRVKVD